jgi:hypothetical protein
MRKAFYLSATALLGVLGYLALGQYTLPEGPGKDLVLAKCQSCHEIGFVARERLSRDRWAGVIEEMELRGLKLTQEERAAILGTTWPPTWGPHPRPQRAPPGPPTGPGPPRTGGPRSTPTCLGGGHGPSRGRGNPAQTFPPLKGHVGKPC